MDENVAHVDRDKSDPDTDLALARRLIASGEYSHGARHLAGVLHADPAHPEGTSLLERTARELGELAPEAVPRDPKEVMWFGDAAVRAWLLHATGKKEEAVRLLMDVIVVDPTTRWSHW